MAAVAFTAMCTAVGIGYAYGALLPHLVTELGISAGTASGVFSVTVLVFFLAGAPAGVLADRGGPRTVLLAGSLSSGAGLLLTSAAQGPALLFLGHGLLLGAGMATTFVPLMAAVARAFRRRRTAAMGVAVSGIGVGTLVMAPLVAWSIAVVGWRVTYAGLGAVTAAVLLACAAALPRWDPAPADALPDAPSTRTIMREGDFRLLYGAQVLLAAALFIPFALLPAFADSAGIPAVPAAGLVGILGLSSVLGRLLLAVLAQRMGVVRTYLACYLTIGASFGLWLLPAVGYPALLLFSVAFGLGYGGFVALLPAVVVERFGLTHFGSLVGTLYTANAVGAGLGPWLAGAAVERHGYGPAAIVGLVGGLLAAAVLSRFHRRRATTAPAAPGSGV